MNKPWDNESHPQTDLAQAEMSEFIIPAVHVEFAQNFERRLRHAERLLERFRSFDPTPMAILALDSDIATHLKAAQQEDGR